MQQPTSYEAIAAYVEANEPVVFFFTADWCPDCQFIYPVLDEIEASYPQLTFVRVNRDDFMDLVKTWHIFGIPSFVVTQNGKELARLVNKQRKTKSEIMEFLDSVKGEIS
ncbi:thioredoxin family protein [Streptococcus sp. zg-JUN1979]|uniref:thioredoxin family protein n=1 Tax=Streptococcus sp. zg-JUN1979 TaxID=3391450 RepID=UPI0039A5E561